RSRDQRDGSVDSHEEDCVPFARTLQCIASMCASTMVESRLLGWFVVAGALLAVALSPSSAPAAGPRGGGFVIPCNYSHTLMDDPIVDPGMPGMSHSHDFFGNVCTNAHSPYPSMVTARTTCALQDGTGGRWGAPPTPA